MDTLEDGVEVTHKTVEVLQTVLTEETLEYFTAPYTETTERAGRRLLEIGPLLYSNPRDALHISLWEALAAMYPNVQNDEAYTRSLFRAGTWELAKMVTSELTWNDLYACIKNANPLCANISKSPKIVPIH
jgi:hypothetical protein